MLPTQHLEAKIAIPIWGNSSGVCLSSDFFVLVVEEDVLDCEDIA
jgi:hypothetical protein